MTTNPYINMNHVTKVTLHEGWIEHKSYHDYKWKRSWLILQGNVVHFFNTQNTSEESPTGILQIEKGFRFLKKDRGSEKAGYKFEIHTRRSITKFKASKFSERELWRAYLEGIATGQVSDSIDLPPEILVQIRLLLQAQHIDINRRSSLAHLDLGDSTEFIPEIPPHEELDGQSHSSDDVSADSGCVDDFYLEPANCHLLNYVFYNDHHKRELPSWFFQNCTRDRAEEILIKGYQYGNTLMRKGSTNTSNLVISKKMEARKEDFSHFVIEIQPNGYKLLVENPHQPMKCLTDIMTFFVQTSGALTTKPMTCNNLHKIGISPDHIYNPVIIPNPTPKPAEKKEEITEYCNIAPSPKPIVAKEDNYANLVQSKKDISKAWMKNRSQSSPNITPLPDLRPDIRRLSISVEAEKSPSPTTPKARFMTPAPDDIPTPPPPPPPPLSSTSVPPPPLSATTSPPPPPPPTSSPPPPAPPTSAPPKLPGTPNRSRVRASNNASPPPPPSDAPPVPGAPGTATPMIKSQLGSTLSLASKFDQIAQKKETPPVAPRPMRNVMRNVTVVDEPRSSGKKLGDAHRKIKLSTANRKENKEEVIYAKIMKKKPSLKQSASVPLSYENWESMKQNKYSTDTKDRLSSLNESKLTYAEINPEPYMMYQDQKQVNYEPVSPNAFEDKHHSKPSHSMSNTEEDSIKSSYETYEVSESVFDDRSPDSVHSFDGNFDLKNKEVFQKMKFFTDDFSKAPQTRNKIKSNSNGIYEPVCDNYKSDKRGSKEKFRLSKYVPNGNGSPRLKSKSLDVENEYETIHSAEKKRQSTPPQTKPRRLLGISSPGEINYESVEWKNKINRPRIPSPKLRRRTNSLNCKTEKLYDDADATKKSNTLNALDDLKSELMIFDEKYYDEVLLNGASNTRTIADPTTSTSNYVDVIADYEDIKAARISQKTLAIRQNSVPEDEFKKKLEMMFGGDNKAKTMPAIRPAMRPLPDKPDLKKAVTPTPSIAPNQDLTADVLYDDLDAYQNSVSLNNIRNK